MRHKIVADGLNDDSFDVTNKGIHLKAQEFNNLLEDPNTIVVDFRNHYESEVGHFEGAITPDVENFRESLPIINDQLQDFKEDKNLLMYCTGGIVARKPVLISSIKVLKTFTNWKAELLNIPVR